MVSVVAEDGGAEPQPTKSEALEKYDAHQVIPLVHAQDTGRLIHQPP